MGATRKSKAGERATIAFTIAAERFREVYIIHREIASGAFPNVTILSRRLNCCDRHVQRMVFFMRHCLDAHIEYDPQGWGYYYRYPFDFRAALDKFLFGEREQDGPADYQI